MIFDSRVRVTEPLIVGGDDSVIDRACGRVIVVVLSVGKNETDVVGAFLLRYIDFGAAKNGDFCGDGGGIMGIVTNL